jgi:hypothetical protein
VGCGVAPSETAEQASARARVGPGSRTDGEPWQRGERNGWVGQRSANPPRCLMRPAHLAASCLSERLNSDTRLGFRLGALCFHVPRTSAMRFITCARRAPWSALTDPTRGV